jgi:hypothetical protein
VLLAFAPAGPEFRVDMSGYATRELGVAADADGDFVVVWRDSDSAASASQPSVYGRRYDASGAPAANPFRISTSTALQSFSAVPAIAMNADGDFLVTWGQIGYLGSSVQQIARFYAADGTPRGTEFLVGGPASPEVEYGGGQVAVDGAGNFAVTYYRAEWNPATRDWVAAGVFGRRYAANGTPLGAAFEFGGPALGAMAMDADGDFVFAGRASAGGSRYHINARRFDRTGAPVGDDVRVNVDDPGDKRAPDVAVGADGNFVVTWMEGDTDPRRIVARRYAADATPLSEPFSVSTVGDFQGNPSVEMDADGNFVIAWDYYFEGGGVVARRFDASGLADGPETMVAQDDEGVPPLAWAYESPHVGMTGNGDFVIAYERNDFANDTQAVYARRYVTDGPPPPAATVAGRHVFYNHSSFDGNEGAANAADDAAITADKSALLATEDRLPGFDNVSSYDRGINGVMIDVQDLPVIDALLDVDDFDFGGAGNPISIDVRPGAGVGGSDRVTLIWRDYNPQDVSPLPQAVGNGWLTVTVKANAHTGLSQADVFSFGNLIGETGDGTTLRVSALDLSAVRRALNFPAPLTSATDFNRDGRTNALDLSTVKRNLNHALPMPGAQAAAPTQAVPLLAPTAAIPGHTRRVADDILV